MTGSVLVGAAAAGLVSGSLQVLPAFGASLVYQQGRYLPLWLPEVAMLAAYGALLMEPLGSVGALAVSVCCGVLLSVALHRGLFLRLIDHARPLEALLAGVGIGQVAQGLASLYGDGMSQHYTTLGRGTLLGDVVGFPVYMVDALSLALGATVVPALVIALRTTHLGLKVRAVLASRDLAGTVHLPVRTVDLLIVATAATLAAGGAIVRAARYDLQPALMAQPGISIVAALVVGGQGRHLAAVSVAVGIEVIVAIVGAIPVVSAFQQAVPFLLLAGALMLRARRVE